MNRSDAWKRATLNHEIDLPATLAAARDFVRRGQPESARELLERSERRLAPIPLCPPPDRSARRALAELRSARFDLRLYRYVASRTREWLGWECATLSAPLWQLDATPGHAWSTHAVVAADADALFLTEQLAHRDEHTLLHAISPHTGERLWKHSQPLDLIALELDDHRVYLQWYRNARTGRSAHHLLEVLDRASGRLLHRHELLRWCFRAPFLTSTSPDTLALVGLDPDSTGVPDNWLDNKQLVRLHRHTGELTFSPLLEQPRPIALHAALHVVSDPHWHRRQILDWYFGTPHGIRSGLENAITLDTPHDGTLLALISRPPDPSMPHSLSLMRIDEAGERLTSIPLPAGREPLPRGSLLHIDLLSDAGRLVLTLHGPPSPLPSRGVHRWVIDPITHHAQPLDTLSRNRPAERQRRRGHGDDLDALEARSLFAGGLWWWASEGTQLVYGEGLMGDGGIRTAWEQDTDVERASRAYPSSARSGRQRRAPSLHPVLQHIFPLGPFVLVTRGQSVACRRLEGEPLS